MIYNLNGINISVCKLENKLPLILLSVDILDEDLTSTVRIIVMSHSDSTPSIHFPSVFFPKVLLIGEYLLFILKPYSVTKCSILHGHSASQELCTQFANMSWRACVNILNKWNLIQSNLCFVVFCFGTGHSYPYPSGLHHWHWGNHVIAPVPMM